VIRPHLRRLVARAVAWGRQEGGGLRILTYHRVNDGHPRDRLTVHPDAFAAQLELLAASGRPVLPLSAGLDALATGRLPDGAVCLTFDDGYADNLEHAVEPLAAHRFPAAFFLATGLIGTGGTLDRYAGCCASDRMLDWDEARALAAAGHELGGHSRTHRELASLPAEEARREAAGCAEDLERETGTRPAVFCYPRGSESPAVRRIVAEAGYRAALTVAPGANRPGADAFGLTRTEVSGADDLHDFRMKLDGGFDAWHRLVQRRAAS
jgi:peptidoglycan/xylan/chitin deacetylase (PgdA/CDA1 family)